MEEILQPNTTAETAGNEQYIAAIKELKENTVSREDYLKLAKENKQLLDSLVNGQTIEVSEAKPSVSIDELKKHLTKEGLSNLDYVKTSLELRNRVLEETGRDLYCPLGTQYSPTEEDMNSAKKVAAQLQEMVDFANGDANVFNAEFQRNIVDVNIPRRK